MRGVTTVLVWVVTLLRASAGLSLSHEPLSDEQIKSLGDREFASYLERAEAMGLDRLREGLRDVAVYEVQKSRLRAYGLKGSAIVDEIEGQLPAERQPDLASVGTVNTLTVLIDFDELREADQAVPLEPAIFAANIYGMGTELARKQRPFDSVAAYYSRASEGQLQIQGQVLDWYSMPGTRPSYAPDETGLTDKQVLAAWNRAYFDIASEVLGKLEAHGFTPYDNDKDGDIDLLTILYAGKADAGRFWGTWTWQFYDDIAETHRFGGKKLKQFIVCPVVRRLSHRDFNPGSLIHEYGHALGLPDLYDRKRSVGPPGGVGGLDIMDQKLGNHNALSRWLLGWIRPAGVGSGEPERRPLAASGGVGEGDKAVAMFPAMSSASPHGEMFLVENRFRVGNDSNTPGEGILIWHVDATLTGNRKDFRFNNSDTERKLIRLLRPGVEGDFDHGCLATQSDYFTSGRELTPRSTPSSAGYAGATGIVVRGFGDAGLSCPAEIGFENGGTGDSGRYGFSSTGSGKDAAVDLDSLEDLTRTLRVETPSQLARRWAALAARPRVRTDLQPWLEAQTVLVQWASKSGADAAAALTAEPESAFSRATLPKVLRAWAHNDPGCAYDWYLDRQQSALRDSPLTVAGAEFVRTIFRAARRRDAAGALRSVALLRDRNEIQAALEALGDSGRGTDLLRAVSLHAAAPSPPDPCTSHRPEACLRAAERCPDPDSDARRLCCEALCGSEDK